MSSLFILEDWWDEQFRRVAVGELGKVFLILSHKIHDVTQSLDVEHIALQHVHHNGTQLLYDSQMQTVSDRKRPVYTYHLATQHVHLFGKA